MRCRCGYSTFAHCRESYSFYFVNRDENCVAHALTRFALNVSDVLILLEDPPQWLEEALLLLFFFWRRLLLLTLKKKERKKLCLNM